MASGIPKRTSDLENLAHIIDPIIGGGTWKFWAESKMAKLEPVDQEPDHDHKEKPKRNHGSAKFFVFVDYLFLLIFFGFLFYVLFKVVNLWFFHPLTHIPLFQVPFFLFILIDLTLLLLFFFNLLLFNFLILVMKAFEDLMYIFISVMRWICLLIQL